MKKIFLYLTLSVLIMKNITAQNKIILTLEDVINTAQQQSLNAFLNKHYYMADYWAYKSYRANSLPSMQLIATPITYANVSQLRYNSVLETDEFVRTENLKSDVAINISQNINVTGGKIYAESDLSRIQNLGSKNYTQFSSRPFRIGYEQELFGFNPLKWQKKIEPLKFEIAKKEFISSKEEMNIIATTLFFDYIKAEILLEIAQTNLENTKKVLQVAEKQFDLGTITREELIDLKLSLNNLKISLNENQLNIREKREVLLNFLMLPTDIEITAKLPNIPPIKFIEEQIVLEKAVENNPQILGIEHNILESKQFVEKTKKEQKFRSNLNVSYGINKDDGSINQSGKLSNAYSPDFDNYQLISLGVNIPILDWGRSKGQYEMAKSQHEITQVASQQFFQKFRQETFTKAFAYNIQFSKVEAALISDSLATESYELTLQRFKKGQTNVLKLNSTQLSKDNAKLQLINNISEYWTQYYSLRKLTLYDFVDNKSIVFDEQEVIDL